MADRSPIPIHYNRGAGLAEIVHDRGAELVEAAREKETKRDFEAACRWAWLPGDATGGASLFDPSRPDDARRRAEGLVQYIASCDPSANKSATEWMVDAYIANAFLLSDLVKVEMTLRAFARVMHLMPNHWGILSSYETPAEIWNTARPMLLRAERNRDRSDESYKAECLVIHEGGDGFDVMVPLTRTAAERLGEGTLWSMGADEFNSFSRQHAEGPVVVITLPDGEKLQLHITRNMTAVDEFGLRSEVPFKGADGRPVSEHVIDEWWDRLEPVMKWAVGFNKNALGLVPNWLKSYELMTLAVRSGGPGLPVPHHLQTREICLEAVRANGDALKYVRDDLVDYEMSLEAVRSKGGALRHVRGAFYCEELCLEAARNDPSPETISLIASRYSHGMDKHILKDAEAIARRRRLAMKVSGAIGAMVGREEEEKVVFDAEADMGGRIWDMSTLYALQQGMDAAAELRAEKAVRAAVLESHYPIHP